MLAASMEGWDYPISREALAILDLFDFNTWLNTDPKKRGQWKAHSGRPFEMEKAKISTRMGNTGGRSREEVFAILHACRDGISPASAESASA